MAFQISQLLLASGILLILWPLLFNPLHLVKAAAPIALPGCQDHCGDVSIPYPFGMTPGCYLEDPFKINCTSNTTPVIFGLEVMRISLEDRTIGFKSSIASSCLSGNGEATATSNVFYKLESTLFSFSSSHNRFTAAGCDSIAVLSENGLTIAGCMPICPEGREEPSRIKGTVNGINCCQTTIPSSLQVLNFSIREVDVDHRYGAEPDCKYAYLVNKTWFHREAVGNLSVAAEMGYVPAVIDWVVDHLAYARILENRSQELNSSSYANRDAYCRTFFSSISNTTAVSCYCEYFRSEGNPYIPNGCIDIDECALNLTICGDPNVYRCENFRGGYGCSIINKSSMKPVYIGLGVGLGVPLLAIGVWILFKVCRTQRQRKLKQKYFKRNGGLLLQEQLLSGEVNVEKVKMFSSKELDKATDHFNANRMLGHGGQGTVYKGMLPDGRIVAVKRSKALDEGKTKEFINEVVILSQVNHRNVVKLLGCCLETKVPLLVYEFIPNGNLFNLLQGHDHDENILLTWEKRLEIAVEASGALAYLHSAASMPIYHRDIKTTNILLDNKYKAKVADFGTSMAVTIDQTHVTTRVQGTFGYMDPEYFRSSQFTDKSDVYSFGVVLVELLTGLKPVSFEGEDQVRSLVHHFLLSMDEDSLLDLVDKKMEVHGKIEEMTLVANLARRCLSWTGKERPTMRDVSLVLEGIQKSHKKSDASTTHAQPEEIMDSFLNLEFTSSYQYSSLDSTDIYPILIDN